MKPLVLCILDGVGYRKEEHGNAVLKARMDTYNYLLNNYPMTTLEACGQAVGLPEGQMGNSEVGHMNIGAGRIVYQPLELINKDIRDNNFFLNKNILEVMNHVKSNNSTLHIFGLLSDGGVHSHINHLLSLIDMCKNNNIDKVYYHLFLDGRDTLANSAYSYISKLEEKIKEVNLGSIATISGRYYAMDRDNRYERIKLAYDAICDGVGPKYNSPKEVIDDNYSKEVYDEFVIPSVLDSEGTIHDNDGLITFNFRPDRLRELFYAITNPDFKEFEAHKYQNIKLVTMMPVSSDVICTNAFTHQSLDNTLGEYLASKGLTQLRIAETEKYAHVTYFMDGGVEKDLEGATRILINSPKVATYDLQPSMSALEVTDSLINELDKNIHDVVILNYANGDMVGHTGDFNATVEALEVLDGCLKRVYDKVKELGGTLLVTADHGNSDVMLDDDNNVITSHSMSLVPFIVVSEKEIELKEGKLSDIAPTMLELLELDIPEEMTGNSLIK